VGEIEVSEDLVLIGGGYNSAANSKLKNIF